MSCRERRAAALAVLVLASCGGGDGDGSGSSTGAPTSEAPAVATSSATTTAAPVEPTAPGAGVGVPLVVDTDLAADDLVALEYLLSDPTVDIVALTVSGTGEATCPRGVDVARGLLAAAGHDEVPVACGQSLPLSGTRAFPAEWRAAVDAAYGLSFPVVEPPADEQTAVELLTAAVAEASTPVRLLTLGPLTNVAQALAAEPALVDGLAGIVIMGGAVDVPGNVEPEGASGPLAAEWNLYIDPEATAAVIASGAPITLVALDATNSVPVTGEFVDRLAANDVNDATSTVLDLLTVAPPPYLWDPLAAIAAAHPDLVPGTARTIAVVTVGEDAGRTVEQADGAALLVADPPDAEAVLDHLLRTLAGVAEGEPLATPTTIPVAGEATVSFDGTTCSYDGPTALPPGLLRVSAVPGPVPYFVLVAHLVEGATLEEALAWQADHPGEQPPMIDTVEAIGEGALPSPANIALQPGLNPVVCGTPDGSVVSGATVEVATGS